MDNSKINMHKRMAMGQKPTGMKKGGMGGRTGDMMYSRGYGVGEKSKRRPTMLKDRGAMKKGGMMKPKKMVAGAIALGALGAMAGKKLMGKKKSSTVKGTGMGGMAAKLAAEKMKKQKQMTQGKMGGGMMMPRYKDKVSQKDMAKAGKMMGGGVAEAARRVRASGMKKGGLKPVNKEKNPGLAKLPTRVRNKMGYMKKGGMRRNTQRMNRLEELGRVDAEKARTKRGKENLRLERKRVIRELKK
jgi:hypothetical protein